MRLHRGLDHRQADAAARGGGATGHAGRGHVRRVL
jgi:hypothetical protein